MNNHLSISAHSCESGQRIALKRTVVSAGAKLGLCHQLLWLLSKNCRSDRIAQVVSGLDKVRPGSGVLSTFDLLNRDERLGAFGLLTEQDALDAIELFYDVVEELIFPIFDSVQSEQDLFRYARAHPENVRGANDRSTSG